MIRILFINRQFAAGGAERQLIELLRRLDKSTYRVAVATFYAGGMLRPEVEALTDIELITVGKHGRWDTVGFLLRLWRIVREVKPNIIHGYLDLANVLALLMGRLVGAKVVWGIRSSSRDYSIYSWTFRLSIALQSWLGRFADRIIVNSQTGKIFLADQGFPASRIVVVPNGIDTHHFSPDPQAGARIRAGWQADNNNKLIGLVARLDPVKDHPTFLRAAARLLAKRNDVRFVCIGDGPDQYADQLRRLANELGIQDKMKWAGVYQDMPAVYNAFDIATLSSTSEGFPNVLAEAMACGLPCVTTDAGDSAMILGETGIIVEAGNPDALANGWEAMLTRLDTQRNLGTEARQRIIDNFGHDKLIQATTQTFNDVLSGYS